MLEFVQNGKTLIAHRVN